jgi:hypothetical protein
LYEIPLFYSVKEPFVIHIFGCVLNQLTQDEGGDVGVGMLLCTCENAPGFLCVPKWCVYISQPLFKREVIKTTCSTVYSALIFFARQLLLMCVAYRPGIPVFLCFALPKVKIFRPAFMRGGNTKKQQV